MMVFVHLAMDGRSRYEACVAYPRYAHLATIAFPCPGVLKRSITLRVWNHDGLRHDASKVKHGPSKRLSEIESRQRRSSAGNISKFIPGANWGHPGASFTFESRGMVSNNVKVQPCNGCSGLKSKETSGSEQGEIPSPRRFGSI